jgi:hypothetical protein
MLINEYTVSFVNKSISYRQIKKDDWNPRFVSRTTMNALVDDIKKQMAIVENVLIDNNNFIYKKKKSRCWYQKVPSSYLELRFTYTLTQTENVCPVPVLSEPLAPLIHL